MRWVPLVVLVLQVHSVPTKRTRIYMASVDLDTNRKRNVDPEVILDIGSQLPPVKRKATTTKAPDYGDYEDYELTAKPEEDVTTLTATTVGTTTDEPVLLDSQFKPHVKISMKSLKSSSEARDEVSRLMGDLHREELTMRTTVSRENMTTMTTTIDAMLGNETMFFEEEEGSGMEEEVDLLNATTTTTRKPLLFTTLIQEVKSVPVTARPDPFEHLDYDLSDHSNSKTPRKKVVKQDRLKKYKSRVLHGGAVDKPSNETTKALALKPKRRKTLRKLNKIDKTRKLKYLNHRVRAQNRMRLRKVLSKMIFGSRDRATTPHKSTKLKFVGSAGVVTPAPFDPLRLNRIDSKTKRARRDKRDTEQRLSAHLQVLEPELAGAGGGWDTAPIETSIIESIPYEPHPSYHLLGTGRTQVEPSPMISETAEGSEEDESYSEEEEERLPVRSGLVHVSLDGNAVNSGANRLKMVTLKSVKKVDKKQHLGSTNGVALVVPTAKRPTMLELLIGDFIERLPPTARSPSYLSREQWS